MMMPHFPVQSFLLSVLIGVLSTAQTAAGQFEIRDREGFEREMIAHVVTVPDGWQSKGRIAWSKPCSSSDLYETLFLTQSSSGAHGARIMPGYQFFQDTAQLAPGYPPDPMLNMMLAQSEAMNQSMATEFRGSNCGVGQLRGTRDILNRLVLPNRPNGASVKNAQANQAELQMMKQTFGAATYGVSVSFDSQIIDLTYQLNSVPMTERLYLSWYNFSQQPMDIGGVIVSNSHTIVEPLRFVWAPSANAAAEIPKLEAILSSIRTNPDWQRRVNKVREEIKRQGNKDRIRRDAENDRRHTEFIETITGTPSSSTSTGGIVSGSNSDATQTEEETDFWGNITKDEDKKSDF